MPNTKTSHTQQNVYQNKEKPKIDQDAHGEVWQDKRAETRARIAMRHPARSNNPMRAQDPNTKTERSKKRQDHKRRTAQLTLWVSPIEKAEIQRRAEREQLSISSVGAALLRKGMQTDLDMQYGALLTTAFENTIHRKMRARDNRLAMLLVRIAFSVEQTRSLTTNILGRQPGIPPEVLNNILDHSAKAAKQKITRRSPELEELINEIKTYLTHEEAKNND